MRDRHVGDVLVRSNGRLRGIATDRDIVVRGVAEGGDVKGAPIGDLLTTDPVMVDADAPIDDAVERMVDHKIRRLPVVEDGRLVGVGSAPPGPTAERLPRRRDVPRSLGGRARAFARDPIAA